MAWDINRVILVGRAANDVDFRKTEGGFSIAKFGLAVGGKPKQDGSDNVSFFDVNVWGRTAEICRDFVQKGKQVAIDGHLEQQRWEAQDGSKRSKIVVVAERVELLGSKSNNSQGGGGYNRDNNYSGGNSYGGDRTNRSSNSNSNSNTGRQGFNDEYYDNSDYDDAGFNDTPMDFGNDNDEVPF